MRGARHAAPGLLVAAACVVVAAAIGCSGKGSKGSQDSTSEEEPIDTVGEEVPVDAHDVVDEEPPVDAHDAVAGEEPAVDGCDQDIPGIIEEYASFCGESPPEHCTNAGCGDCQVCSADVVCSPPSVDAYPDCECCGDGECYDLCGDDGDCAEGSACRLIGWFEAYDDYTQLLRICWPSDDPAGSICP